MAVHPPLALLHHGADGRGGRVEDVHAELLHDLPEAVGLRVAGHALEHERRGAVGERPVHEVRVPRDPPRIGRAPVDVRLLQVEHVLHGERGVQQVAAGTVHDALRLGRAAAGVEHEQRLVRLHARGLAGGRGAGHEVVPPQVALGGHLGALLDAAHDDAAPHLGALVDRFVAEILEVQDLARTVAVVGRDHHAGAGVEDAVAQRVGGQAAEHDAVHGADAGAGEHRDGQLGDHGKVEHHAVALPHAQVLEHVGGLAHLAVQALVGVHLHLFGGLALPDEGGLVAPRSLQVPVEAVGGGVELGAAEVADERAGGLEVVLLHRVPRAIPVQRLAGHLAPERLGLVDRAAVQLVVVLAALHEGLVAELGGRLDHALVFEHLPDEGGAGVLLHEGIPSTRLGWGAESADRRGAGAPRRRCSRGRGRRTPRCGRRRAGTWP